MRNQTLSKCTIYNRSDANETCADLTTCPTYSTCKFCFAVYVTTNNTEVAHLAGCGGNSHVCPRNNTNKCVLKHSTKDAHYCCCYGNQCNRNVEIIPENLIPIPQVKPTIDLLAKQQKLGGKNQILYILPPIFGLVILVAVVLRLFKNHKRQIARDIPLLPSPPHTPPLNTSPIEFLEVISRGQFGFVWKARYHDNLVAVKMIPMHERKSWENEHTIYGNHIVRHENVLTFISAEKRNNNGIVQYWIITEYQQHGSLFNYLHENLLSFELFTQFALNIISGLVYLHNEDSTVKPIIAHLDLKSSNILIKNDFTCCISDFGSAFPFPRDGTNLEFMPQAGTKRYMAPEVLQGAIAFKTGSFLCIDIYALALVLWELLSRLSVEGDVEGDNEVYKPPYLDEVGLNPTLEDMREVVVTQNCRPVLKQQWYEDECLNEYCNCIEECWDEDGDARLTAHCVYQRLVEWPQHLTTTKGGDCGARDTTKGGDCGAQNSCVVNNDDSLRVDSGTHADFSLTSGNESMEINETFC